MKVIILILSILVSQFIYSQKRMQKQVFSYEMKTQVPGIKKIFLFYFIIDSSIIYKYKNFLFYRFTFSEDSTELSGFVSYADKKDEILYLSDTIRGKIYTQKLFQFGGHLKEYRVNYLPYIGKDLIFKRQSVGNTMTYNIIYSAPIESHTVYIKNIKFIKGKLVPYAIVFKFPFEEMLFIELKALCRG